MTPHGVDARALKLGCLLVLSGLIGIASEATAQTLRLRQAATGADQIQEKVGAVVAIEAIAELAGVPAAGLALFLSIPDGPFQVVDYRPAVAGTQPFQPGPLFAGGSELDNSLVSAAETPALFAGYRLLDYAVLLKPGPDRQQSGSGVVATFQLRCVRPVAGAQIRLDYHPLRETRLVLTDGVTERSLAALEGMKISVKGIELKDIPDVHLLPGQADVDQIGRLDNYVLNNREPLDLLRWSFSGAGLDSLSIEIDPRTRRVTITPLKGWTGRRRLTWRVAEPSSILPGEPALADSDVADITVNTPPRFRVRRDTVRFAEDRHTYRLPATGDPSPARAFRGRDLDLMVEDPDVRDPHSAFRYAVLRFRPVGDDPPRLKASVDPVTHELLLWSRPDFSGVDSLRVVVANDFAVGQTVGQDSLRLVVEVEEVPDAPKFIFAETVLLLVEGQQRTVLLADFVTDPDTPLERLGLTWTPDLGGTFAVERQADGLVFRSRKNLVGQGLFIFEVTDPDGLKDRLVLRVTMAPIPVIPPGPDPPAPDPDFQVGPLPPLFVREGDFRKVLTLDDYVQVGTEIAKSSLVWGVRTLDDSLNALVGLGIDRTVNVLGLTAGLDTLRFTATDLLGRQRQVITSVEVVAREYLRLLPIPDIRFVVGHTYTGLDLDEFVGDRTAHPDSVVEWRVAYLAASSVLVKVKSDHSTVITSSIPADTRVAFTATNPVLGATGRDTVRIEVVSRIQGQLALKQLPEVALVAGQVDTSVRLDDYLPAHTATDTVWSVAGQTILVPLIDTEAPHVLRLEADAATVGRDTLTFSVSLGRGFTASGSLRVTVREPVDENTLRIEIVPNPFQPHYLALYVAARRALSRTPVLLRTLAGIERALPLKPIEADLDRRGVAIWSSATQLPRGLTGMVSFGASAQTIQGTQLRATASLAAATVGAGKPAVLRHLNVELALPAGAAANETWVLLQAVEEPDTGGGTGECELRLQTRICLYPAGLPLQQRATLALTDSPHPGRGLYSWDVEAGDWKYAGADGPAQVAELGQYGVLSDGAPPQITVRSLPGEDGGFFFARVKDGGSGVDAGSVQFAVDGEEGPGAIDWSCGCGTGPATRPRGRSTSTPGVSTCPRTSCSERAFPTRSTPAPSFRSRCPWAQDRLSRERSRCAWWCTTAPDSGCAS